jgi:hypothetical protein
MFPFSEIVTACGCILFSSIKKIWLGVKKKKGGAALEPQNTHIFLFGLMIKTGTNQTFLSLFY